MNCPQSTVRPSDCRLLDCKTASVLRIAYSICWWLAEGGLVEYGPLLIVEDSDEDFYAMKRALAKILPCEVVRCRTGNEALDYLFRRDSYVQAVLPSLVLLDLNLPGKDGRVVLEQVKQDATLRAVPVVVVSTSDNPADIARCYTTGCSGYLVKALAYERLATALQTLCAYWFTVVTLPRS